MADNIGERLASLETAFDGFRNQMLTDNEYIKNRVDKIVEALPLKVDRPYCQDRHEKLQDRIAEAEKNGGKEEILKRLRELEQQTPVIVQNIVLAVMTAVITAVAIKMVP